MEHHCKKCDAKRPVRYTDARRPDGSEVHYKSTCGNCGVLIGFVYMTEIPYFKDSGQRILSLTKDLAFIERIKAKMKFDSTKVGVQKNIEYSNLYLEIINSAFNP